MTDVPAFLRCGPYRLPLGQRTLLMAVLNVTPDSFSGDGVGNQLDAALSQGRRLVQDGADILDVGGESTRPGALPVSLDEELGRVLPVIERLAAEVSVPISVDTYKPAVAEAALARGACIVNDITGLHASPEMAEIAARHGAAVVAMHMQGTPRDMQDNPTYVDLLGEIAAYLDRSIQIGKEAGLTREQIVVDPGIGFGKTVQHNLELIRRLSVLRRLGQPLLIGVSRKGFIGRILGGLPPSQRVEGTAAAVALSIANGADIVRVHDVATMARVARVADAVVRGYREA